MGARSTDRAVVCPTSPRGDWRADAGVESAKASARERERLTMMLPSRAQLPDEAELTWDAGDAHPEPALDNLPPHIVTKNTAAMYLMGGFAVLGGVYATAVAVDKPSKVPFAPKTFPYNGLEAELGKKTA